MKKKFFILTLFLLVTCVSLFSQTENDTLFSKIFNILDLKHNYEASVLIELKRIKLNPIILKNMLKTYSEFGIKVSEPRIALKAYKDSISTIKNFKSIYNKLLDEEFKKENNFPYSKLFVFYDFQDPLSSIVYKGNTMTKLDFLKLFKKYIFEDELEVLTPLIVPKIGDYKFSLE